MKRTLTMAAAAGLALIVVMGVAAYAYFFSGLRTSPASLTLSSPPASSSPPNATTGLAATWKVAAGSLTGYRVQELFVGETSKHQAVARTANVSGGLTVSGDASGYRGSGIPLTANVTSLDSADQAAGRDVSQRDGIVTRQLETHQVPNPTFTAATATVPAILTSSPVAVTLPRTLTIPGVT